MREVRTWSTQVASDVIHDGLGLELLDAGGAIRVEVLRCDADKTVLVTFGDGVRPPSAVLEGFFAEAVLRLGNFDDGSARTPSPRGKGAAMKKRAAVGGR